MPKFQAFIIAAILVMQCLANFEPVVVVHGLVEVWRNLISDAISVPAFDRRFEIQKPIVNADGSIIFSPCHLNKPANVLLKHWQRIVAIQRVACDCEKSAGVVLVQLNVDLRFLVTQVVFDTLYLR